MVAAGLKLAGSNSASLIADNPLDRPWVRLGAIEWELLLGLWLVAGSYYRAAWLFGLLTFSAFAAVGTYFGFNGHTSCNCLGAVATRPWVMVALDVIVLVALLRTRPGGVAFIITWRSVTIAAIATLTGFTLFGTSGGEAAQDRVRTALLGSHLKVAENRFDFGRHAPGEIVFVDVEVGNVGGEPLTVVGGTNDCSLHVTGVPRVVPPHGTANVQVGLKIPERKGGRYARRMELWTDAPTQPRLRLASAYEVP